MRTLLISLLFTLLSLIFLIIAGWCFIFIPTFSFSISLFFLFLSVSILLVLFGGGLDLKYIKICEDKLIFRQVFGLGYHKYTFPEIFGFKTTILKNKKREYLQLLIKTSSERVLEINGFSISNISEIERELNKIVRYDSSIKEPIINLKDKLFILFIIFILICFSWFLISLF